MRNKTKFLLGGLIGFTLFTLSSHPKSKAHKKLPAKKIGRFQILPHIRYHSEETIYHLHHWMDMTVLYLLLHFFKKGRIKSRLLHGFFIGSIVQGLIYKDRFHIVKKVSDFERELKLLK